VSDTLNTVILGIIEGITEFLPISSTGHLLIAERWLGERSELFNVSIQAGAILAIVLIYWRRLLDLLLHFNRPAQRDYLTKLVAAFLITATGGFIATRLGWKLPESVLPIALATLSREHEQDNELMMAGAVLTVLPVLLLFLALQRYYIRGILMGSVKG